MMTFVIEWHMLLHLKMVEKEKKNLQIRKPIKKNLFKGVLTQSLYIPQLLIIILKLWFPKQACANIMGW